MKTCTVVFFFSPTALCGLLEHWFCPFFFFFFLVQSWFYLFARHAESCKTSNCIWSSWRCDIELDLQIKKSPSSATVCVCADVSVRSGFWIRSGFKFCIVVGFILGRASTSWGVCVQTTNSYHEALPRRFCVSVCGCFSVGGWGGNWRTHRSRKPGSVHFLLLVQVVPEPPGRRTSYCGGNLLGRSARSVWCNIFTK